jgi:hypothetical protein
MKSLPKPSPGVPWVRAKNSSDCVRVFASRTIKLSFDKAQTIIPAFNGVLIQYRVQPELCQPPKIRRETRCRPGPCTWMLKENVVNSGVWMWKSGGRGRTIGHTLTIWNGQGGDNRLD